MYVPFGTRDDKGRKHRFTLLSIKKKARTVAGGDGGGLLRLPFDPRIELREEGALENANELTI